MMNNRMENLYKTAQILCVLFMALAMAACNQASGTGCIDCHTDKDKLKEVADPIDPTTSSGEG